MKCKYKAIFLTVVIALFAVKGAFAADSLRIGLTAPITGLDPQKAGDIITFTVTKQMYNTLVKLNNKNEVVPDLAVSWEFKDATTCVFHLRKGVKFHNGDEMTAHDVKFSFDRALDPKADFPAIVYIRKIKKVDALDRYTVGFTLSEPYAPLLYTLTRPDMGIVSEKEIKKAGANYDKNPVGTGPFKFKNRVVGDYVTLERFDNYFEGPAKLKSVTFVRVQSDEDRVKKLERGEIDILPYNAPSDAFARLGNNPKFKTYSVSSMSIEYMFMNTATKPFDSVLVRRAVNYAVDSTATLNALGQISNVQLRGPLPNTSAFFDNSLSGAPYPQNRTLAKKLLAQAGYPNGFSCTLHIDDTPRRKKIAAIVKSQLDAVGVKVNVTSMPRVEFIKLINGGDVKGMGVVGWVGTPDPDGTFGPLYHSENIGSSNDSHFRNKTVDALIEEARSTTHRQRRNELYKRLQELIVSEAPIVFLHQVRNLAISTADVEGFAPYPDLIAPFYPVHVK